MISNDARLGSTNPQTIENNFLAGLIQVCLGEKWTSQFATDLNTLKACPENIQERFRKDGHIRKLGHLFSVDFMSQVEACLKQRPEDLLDISMEDLSLGQCVKEQELATTANLMMHLKPRDDLSTAVLPRVR